MRGHYRLAAAGTAMIRPEDIIKYVGRPTDHIDTPDEEPGVEAMTIEEFLLARLAEDEVVIASHGQQIEEHHVDRFTYSRLWAEAEMKRRMLDLLHEVNDEGVPRLTIYLQDRLPRLLAWPYRGHPDFRPEWSL